MLPHNGSQPDPEAAALGPCEPLAGPTHISNIEKFGEEKGQILWPLHDAEEAVKKKSHPEIQYKRLDIQ